MPRQSMTCTADVKRDGRKVTKCGVQPSYWLIDAQDSNKDWERPRCEQHARQFVKSFVQEGGGVIHWQVRRVRDGAIFDLKRPEEFKEAYLLSKGRKEEVDKARAERWADYESRIFSEGEFQFCSQCGRMQLLAHSFCDQCGTALRS